MPESSGHMSPENMIANGEEFATFEDLEGLDVVDLQYIAHLCPEPALDPDACVPCRAYVLLLQKPSAEEAEDKALFDSDAELESIASEIVARHELKDITETHPKLVASLAKPPPWEDPTVVKPNIVQDILDEVTKLQELVYSTLAGPPIPPKNVSLEELATLTVAAQKWSHGVDSQVEQGFALSEGQQAFKAAVDALIERFQSNAV